MVNIKQLIKDRGISQLELSRLLNEHTSVISLMVNGKREVTDAHLRKLEAIFGVEEIAKYDGLTDEDIAERQVRIDIKALIVDYNITQTDIATILDEPQSVVSTLANGKRQPMKRHIDALVAHFGKEVIDSYTIPDTTVAPQVQQATVTIFDSNTLQSVKDDIAEEEAIPMLPSEIATEPEQDIRMYIESSGSELERVNPTQLLRHADVAEKILHTSMFPTFQPEDIVFVRFIPHAMHIVDGNTYYIDSKTYPTLIRRVKLEGDSHLRLIAQNKQFADIIIPRADINNLGAIVGLLRMNFGNQYDEMEELRHKKDSHLERMMELLEQSTEQQGKLIDFITNDRK